jgi:hypothetical protein
MVKRRYKGTLISMLIILTLILIPLLSPNAAATVTYFAGTGTSALSGVGTPSVTITMSAPATFPGGTSPLVVNFNYTFAGWYPPPFGSGSWHICNLTTTQTSPPGGSVTATSSWTFIAANTGATSGTLTTTNNFQQTSPPITIIFTIEVYMKVYENGNPSNNATGTGSTTVTIT